MMYQSASGERFTLYTSKTKTGTARCDTPRREQQMPCTGMKTALGMLLCPARTSNERQNSARRYTTRPKRPHSQYVTAHVQFDIEESGIDMRPVSNYRT